MTDMEAIHMERAAEALWQFDAEHAFGHVKPWGDVPDYSKKMYRGMAKLAVEAFLKPVESAQWARLTSDDARRTSDRPGFTL